MPPVPHDYYIDTTLYPISIFEDRYTGVYSGGKWIAVANSDMYDNTIVETEHYHKTHYELAFEGTHSDDITAGEFGYMIKFVPWIAVGNTPNEALENLQKKNKVIQMPQMDYNIKQILKNVEELEEQINEI